MKILFLFAAFLCFLVKALLTLFGGSSGKLDLDALGMTLFVAAFIFG